MILIRSLAAGLPTLLYGALARAQQAESPARLVESPLSTGNLLETLAGLVFVVGLILGLAWLVRRLGRVPGASRGQLQILGGVSLGTRERVVLLSVEGTRLLVGVAPGRVQTLHVLGPDETPAPAEFAGELQDAVTGAAS